MPIGLWAVASSHVSPETLAPLEGSVIVVVGAGTLTVTVAALVVADPAELVNTARTSHPFSKNVIGPLVRVGDVNPATSNQVDPPSTESCHCTVGLGEPFAAAVNVTVWPYVTVWLSGLVVMDGATSGFTVRTAG